MAFQDVVNQSVALIIAGFREKYPEFDLRPGVPMYDLLIQPFQDIIASVVEVAENRLMVADLNNADKISEADWDMATAIYFKPRKQGKKAAGTVRLEFSKAKDLVLPTSTKIGVAGLTYYPTEAVAATPSSFSAIASSPAGASKITNNTATSIVSLQETAASSIATGSFVLSVLRGSTTGSFLFRYNGIESREYASWPSNSLIELEGGPGAGKIVVLVGINPPSILPAQDVVAVTAAASTYVLDLDVEAEEAGSKFEAGVGIKVTIESLAGDADFLGGETVTILSGGLDKQTNSEHLEDIRQGIGVRNLVNKRSIKTVLGTQFEQIERIVVVGHQEPEMRRDRLKVMERIQTATGEITVPAEVALGNKADIYVKVPLERRTVTVTVSEDATIDLSEYDPVLKIHSMGVVSDPSINPFYVRTATDSTVWLSARGMTTLVVDPSLVGRTVTVDLTRAPDVTAIQEFIESDDEKILLGDLLVRSFLPVWLSGIIYVSGADGKEDVIKQAIGRYVETLEPGTPLTLSAVTKVIEETGVGYVVQQYALAAEIFHADGSREEMVSEEVLSLEAPSDSETAATRLAKGFTPRLARWVVEAIEVVDIRP